MENHDEFKPIIYDYSHGVDTEEINRLREKLDLTKIVDQIEQQLEELYCIRHPDLLGKPISSKDYQEFKKNVVPNSMEEFGSWVYYPWKGYLVHFLPEHLHQELRTARNRNLITKEEQEAYYNAHIAIAGLSVGNSAAATIVYTGGGKNLRLADHDVLSASNINRIRTSFTNLGMKKVGIVAHEIYEVNPYAQLRIYQDGVEIGNLEEYLLRPNPVDVLIEEMDNIYLKIQIRLAARKYRIPVIMATDNGDNILLDIERFDREPNRPLFHGDISEQELLSVTPDLPKPEAARMITRWVHPENVAPRMKTSLLELGKTLYSWPQLGNAAFLAGCSLAFAARHIVSSSTLESGKYIISLDDSIRSSSFTQEDIKNQQRIDDLFKDMLKL